VLQVIALVAFSSVVTLVSPKTLYFAATYATFSDEATRKSVDARLRMRLSLSLAWPDL
jgi:hypothetical protein